MDERDSGLAGLPEEMDITSAVGPRVSRLNAPLPATSRPVLGMAGAATCPYIAPGSVELDEICRLLSPDCGGLNPVGCIQSAYLA